SLDDLIEAGLARPPVDGRGAIDTFRDRITFEIADAGGKIIAFGARALDPNAQAKYINSPETALFHKGRTLYRLKAAREILAKTKAEGLVVGEGYLDVIAFERAGVGAVAPLGTALTEDQLQLLWRAGPEPILCFDGDGAGQRAAARALDLALPHLGPGRTVRIALLPAGEDPDDVYRRAGGAALKEMLANAQPAFAALFERERLARPLETPEAKADFKKRLKEAAFRIQDEETRRLYLSELMKKADAAIGAGRAPYQPGARAPYPPRGAQTRPAGPGGGRGNGRSWAQPLGPTAELKALSAARREARIERLLRLAVDHPKLLDQGADQLAQAASGDAELEIIKSALLDAWHHAQSVDRAGLSLHLRQSGELRAAERLDAWPRPRISKEDMEADWTALAAQESQPAAFAEAGRTQARVAARGSLKAAAARPRPISAQNEAEWQAQIGVDLAAAAIREEARALHDRVDDDAEAMARAQELLRDRLRAQGEALRISQAVGADPTESTEEHGEDDH
ncbi:MAG: toprim domain-containing protein, partial [Hyphomonadaceae bacterium]